MFRKPAVANKYAKQCLVSVAYAIGRAEPLMVSAIDEKGNDLSKIVLKNFDFKPKAIIDFLELRNPVFSGTASYGHFGKDGFSWEKIVEL
jgi:S-adenosylmethionine synthetase